MKTRINTTVAVFLLALALVAARASAAGDASFKDLRIEGIVKPEDLKKTAEFVVEASDRVNAVFGSYTSRVDQLLGEMNTVSGEVAQGVNAWMNEPNEENKTRLREIVTDSALRIKTAADALASEGPKMAEVVKLAQTNIQAKVDETTTAAARITETLSSLSKQREAMLAKMKSAYESLQAAGDGKAEMSPEMQEELAKLKTDWTELNFIAEQWSSKGKRMQAFAQTMSQANARFESVERMVRVAGYQASSFSRMASTIGGQGADDIPLELWEKTFGELTKFEDQIKESSERFASVPFDLGQLRDAGNASWQPASGATPGSPEPPQVDGKPLLAWLKDTVEGSVKQARVNQK